jgi:hypothetical protein
MPIIHDANEVRLCGEELRRVIWQGRQWAVTTFGIESRDGLYAIRARRLTEGLREDDPHCWIDLMAGKEWVDLPDFATAFLIACSVHRVRLKNADVDLVQRRFEKCMSRIERRERLRPFREEAKRRILGETIRFIPVSKFDEIDRLAAELEAGAGSP